MGVHVPMTGSARHGGAIQPYNEWRFLAPRMRAAMRFADPRLRRGEYQIVLKRAIPWSPRAAGVNYYMSVTADSGANIISRWMHVSAVSPDRLVRAKRCPTERRSRI
jgi:hypothetical protein